MTIVENACRRHLWLLAPLASWLSGCGSCRHAEERRWALCACEYVTDMDYPGKVMVEACGEASRQSDVAKSCALISGVGAVLACSCEAADGGLCRDNDMCRDVGR